MERLATPGGARRFLRCVCSAGPGDGQPSAHQGPAAGVISMARSRWSLLAAKSDRLLGGSFMTTKRKVEVFSAGCPACEETITLINRVACPSCEVNVLDMKDANVASRAKRLGIRSVPAVVVDGKLADCCAGPGPEEATLRAAGLGVARP